MYYFIRNHTNNTEFLKWGFLSALYYWNYSFPLKLGFQYFTLSISVKTVLYSYFYICTQISTQRLKDISNKFKTFLLAYWFMYIFEYNNIITLSIHTNQYELDRYEYNYNNWPRWFYKNSTTILKNKINNEHDWHFKNNWTQHFFFLLITYVIGPTMPIIKSSIRRVKSNCTFFVELHSGLKEVMFK